MNRPRPPSTDATCMQVEVDLFAGARDACDGRRRIVVTVTTDATAGEVLTQMGEQFPPLAALAARSRLAAADAFLDHDTIVPVSGPLSLIPPVSGG